MTRFSPAFTELLMKRQKHLRQHTKPWRKSDRIDFHLAAHCGYAPLTQGTLDEKLIIVKDSK